MNTSSASSNDSNLSLLSTLRAFPRPVWILFFGTFLNKFGTFVVPFLTLYLLRQGYTLADAGIAIGSYGVGHLLASFIGGHLADTIGRRKTIMLSMFSAAAAMMLLSQARGLPMITLLAALAGLTGELYRPASSALLADLVTPAQRVTAYSAYRLAFNAGWAFGPATAGFLAGRGYFWLFLGDALTSALFGVIAYFALPRTTIPRERESGFVEGLRVIRRDKKFHQLLLAAGLIAMLFFQMSSTYGVFVTNLGFSAKTYGALISLNGALVVLFELPLTRFFSRRFPARQVIAAGYLMLGTGFALNLLSRSVPALATCVVIFTLGEMMALPVSLAYIAQLAPANMRGRYMGIHALTWATALVVGPWTGMKLLGIHPPLLWLGGGAISILAATVILWPGRSIARDRNGQSVLATETQRQ